MGIWQALRTLCAMREQPQREAAFAAQMRGDWRESFTGSIDEFVDADLDDSVIDLCEGRA